MWLAPVARLLLSNVRNCSRLTGGAPFETRNALIKVSWVSSSSVLSLMYWAISPSSCETAVVYGALPPVGVAGYPGICLLARADTSFPWMPANSVYCSQRSVSMISAAASQRRMAVSPRVRWLLPESASADGTFSKIAAPAVTAAPATTLFLRNERRLKAFFAEKEELSSPLVWFKFESVCSGRLRDFMLLTSFAD